MVNPETNWTGARHRRRGRRFATASFFMLFITILTFLLLSNIRHAKAAEGVLRTRGVLGPEQSIIDTTDGTLDDTSNTSESLQDVHVGGAALQDGDESTLASSSFSETSGSNFTSSTAFPSYEAYNKLVQDSIGLPDLVYIPFEEVVKEETLQGWEYDWIAHAEFSTGKWGKLEEPKIDFVYTWVNGSDEAFQSTKNFYELNSTLNDAKGEWLKSHGTNRYRDWSELKYSIRSVSANAPFRNRIQVLVNAVDDKETGLVRKQHPNWLKSGEESGGVVEVLSQEEFFDPEVRGCLPGFNSLTIENQLQNTPSDVDRLFALSDDMLLGKPHAASDIYSPMFGPALGFKTNAYNTKHVPNEADAKRFGEKPWLIYTSWLLNRRFGYRKRFGQVHFGHSMGRQVAKEVAKSFPKPALQAACSRFRGDLSGFHLYPWYANFHYTMERHREVLLWSYLILRSDADGDGLLSWSERQKIIEEIKEGNTNVADSSFRMRTFYHVPDILESAGLEAPMVNTDVLWTSMDGPMMIKNIDCINFDVNECLAPGFSIPMEGEAQSPMFSTSTIFDRAARQQPECGDCLIKILLNRVKKGLSPMLPVRDTQLSSFEMVVKALMRYKYSIVDPDAMFMMVTDAEQVESTLIKRFKKQSKIVGQLCLNDDVTSEDAGELQDVKQAMTDFYDMLFPHASPFER